MKVRTEVSEDKLRGGFYTPPELVGFVLARAMAVGVTQGLCRRSSRDAGIWQNFRHWRVQMAT